jgi:DNA replication and repair protein RecF
MRLAWVELRDFRNHAHTRIDPMPDGLLVAVGPNGEGKTNLLEGMHVLYALSSPRTATNEALVRDGAAHAYARGEFETREGRVLVEVEIPRRGAMRVQVNRSPVRRRRDLRRQVRAVLFGPFDLPIVIGDPSRRRGFLDEAVVALHPAGDTLTSGYERVLRQRNRLLKEHDGPGGPPDLEAWDEQLVAAGAQVIRARAEAASLVAAPAAEEFRHLAGDDLTVRYRPNVWPGAEPGAAVPGGPAPEVGDVEGAFRARLADRRADELVRRSSLVGPHRDDLELAVRDLGARAAGSHGETWAVALCLRLGIATAVTDAIGEPPLLLVDDPYSALDPRRRDRIGERLRGRGGQVVISVADEADVPTGADAIWDVRAGAVAPREAA